MALVFFFWCFVFVVVFFGLFVLLFLFLFVFCVSFSVFCLGGVLLCFFRLVWWFVFVFGVWLVVGRCHASLLSRQLSISLQNSSS